MNIDSTLNSLRLYAIHRVLNREHLTAVRIRQMPGGDNELLHTTLTCC